MLERQIGCIKEGNILLCKNCEHRFNILNSECGLPFMEVDFMEVD